MREAGLEVRWRRPVAVAFDLNGPVSLPKVPLPPDFAERPWLDCLRDGAAHDPDAIAIVDRTARITYRALLPQIMRAARVVAALVPDGAALAIVLPETAASLICLLGGLVADRVCILLEAGQPKERIAAILRDAKPFAVLTQDGQTDVIPDGARALRLSDIAAGADDGSVPPSGDPDAPAIVTYTSGSTGRPKGIVTSRYATLYRAWTSIENWHLGPADRLLGFNSFATNSGLARHLSALCAGARLILCSVATEGPDVLLARIQQEACTIVVLGPALLRAMVALPNAARGLSSVRSLRSGGAAMLPADLMATRRVVPPDCLIDHTYASTEAGIVAQWYVPADAALDEARVPSGFVLPDQEIAFLAPDGQPVANGGELAIRGRCVASGEWENGRCVPGRMVTDAADPRLRWFRTGDAMQLGADGLLRFVGRGDAQIKINGVRIELAEIEAVLRREPGVADAVVVPRGGAAELRLIAYVAAPGGDTDSLHEALAARLLSELMPAMRPARVVVLDELPRLPTGKIDPRALPEPAPISYRAPRDAREALLCQLFATCLDGGPVGIDDSFFARGGDSLSAMRLMTALREATGHSSPLHLLYAHPTPATLATELEGAAPYAPLLPFRANGDLPPLFCVHPVSGYALAFRPIAESLDARLPVWGLQASGLEPGETPHETIGEMAAAYVTAIRGLRPNGPYHLLGWSVGGLIAHEMACQLEAEGETVSLLALLDTQADPDRVPIDAVAAASPADARAGRVFRARAVARGLLPPETPTSWGSGILEQMRRGKARVAAHQPGQCRAPVLLFRAMLEPADPRDAAAFAWERRTSGLVERVPVACRHAEIGDAAHAGVIAAALWRRLTPDQQDTAWTR